MAKFNQNGQWSLTGNEDTLLFKTGEKKQSGKNEIIKRKSLDPNSEEAKEFFNNLAKSILSNAPKQPTDEELFGHLVVSEEQVKKAEENWNNQIKDFYKTAREPVKEEYSREHEGWGTGKSFNSTLSKKELAERLKHSTD